MRKIGKLKYYNDLLIECPYCFEVGKYYKKEEKTLTCFDCGETFIVGKEFGESEILFDMNKVKT